MLFMICRVFMGLSKAKRRKRLGYRSKSHTIIVIIAFGGRRPIDMFLPYDRLFSRHTNRKKRTRPVVFCC